MARLASTAFSAESLVREALVWDNHGCLPLSPDDERFLPELARYRDSGVNAVSLNIGFGEQSIEQHFRMAAHFRAWLARRPQQYLVVKHAGERRRSTHAAVRPTSASMPAKMRTSTFGYA